jgi:hypothetical protein
MCTHFSCTTAQGTSQAACVVRGSVCMYTVLQPHCSYSVCVARSTCILRRCTVLVALQCFCAHYALSVLLLTYVPLVHTTHTLP